MFLMLLMDMQKNILTQETVIFVNFHALIRAFHLRPPLGEN